MNLDRVVFWIRLIAWAVLDVLHGFEPPRDGGGNGGRISPWFKPERIQVWIDVLARAALTAVEGVVPPAESSGPQSRGNALWPWFKPERIQFWIGLAARLVLAVIDGLNAAASEETGKSGVGAPASEEADN